MNRVQQEMTRRVMYALEGDNLAQAYATMVTMEVRHVPVLRDGTLVGILSDRDILLQATPDRTGKPVVPRKLVSEVMTKHVYTCRANESIGSVADAMLEHKIDALPVIDDNQKLVGIITSTDLIRLLRNRDWEIKMPIPFKFETHSLLGGELGYA